MATKKPRKPTRRPAAKTRSTPAIADDMPDDIVDKVVLLLVTIRSRADVRRQCVENEKLRLTEDQADAAIDEAGRRIRLAAACDFDRELGTAKTRLAQLYGQAAKVMDFKTALAVQKETNKLLGLHARSPAAADPAGGDDTDALELLAAVRDQLAPLVDADADEPLEEIARRVVGLFCTAKARR